MPATSREVIDEYYRTVNGGLWDEWLLLFTDDVVVDEQLAGHCEGIDVLRGAIDAMKRGYSRFEMIPEHTVLEETQAAVMWHCLAANAAGVPIDVRGANYFQITDGKISYMSNFHDKGGFAPFTDQQL